MMYLLWLGFIKSLWWIVPIFGFLIVGGIYEQIKRN